MLFIHPMWDSETQRIGKQKCSAAAYTLHTVADLIGFGSLIAFLVVLGFSIAGRASAWYSSIPVGAAIVGKVLFDYSWLLAERSGWQYDGTEASWMENGERRTYRWTGATRNTP